MNTTVSREYHKWFSPHMNRDMELLIFGSCSGASSTFVPAIVFPTAHGRFYEFEDNGMVSAARFEPPLAPEVQQCAAQTIYRVRFSAPGAIRIPLDVTP